MGLEKLVKASTRNDAGVVKVMGLYLSDSSLEYEIVWDTKPVWIEFFSLLLFGIAVRCQPWTIVGTGVVVITASWLFFRNAFLFGCATFVISLWWYRFLNVYPQHSKI